MELRTLHVGDYDALFALWKRAGLTSLRPDGRDGRREFEAQMARGIQKLFGLEEEGRLVASVMVTDDGRKGWVNRLVVDPARRGEGHARRLVAVAEEELRARGLTVVAALIEDDNDPSLTLFRSLGYELHREILYLVKKDHPGA